MTENKSQEGTDSVARKGQVDSCGHQAPGPRGTRTLCVPLAPASHGVFLRADLHDDLLLLNWFLHKAGVMAVRKSWIHMTARIPYSSLTIERQGLQGCN